jgi:DNA-directed RNA polymerase subunit RPC12/RpoP
MMPTNVCGNCNEENSMEELHPNLDFTLLRCRNCGYKIYYKPEHLDQVKKSGFEKLYHLAI